ncbi:MAG: SDR family NAD(P)-dependent oxidoreductase [Rhodospirillaceae bacterium]|nr:SDR family NAD(P)-dependent oxidoreductase [Rhodospirillaceae bacterium]MBT3809829.1 SDR family NAD(P)-dependent oxidoreductase [Rhodospirillaceae bacterium]MBT3932171.1 SDR family NAD(P)-dependent oxidoreductase [Rhodospirillaceae bacterium]MBT4773860.1 SDR family NAD(P)-dependent oxidoreductase [Rhodospirillaceae bacterium]MBT5357427.1 SDR family NAD(P)-dependent oxidoreductase [Rhodospirillaceae bacterium]
MTSFDNPGHVLITGASSGIGAALACAYAAPGRRLSLGGRNAAHLDEVATACRASGALCETRQTDVTDRESMTAWIAEADAEQALDLVVANAGISGGTIKLGNAPDASDAEIFATNVDGTVNTLEPALAGMLPRNAGQVAIVSSLASFRAFGEAPAYCASKAAVRFYGEGLQRAHRRSAVGISVICPGFVRSPMTDANNFRMPMLMDTDVAAHRIVSGLAHGRSRIAFPLSLYVGIRMLSLF